LFRLAAVLVMLAGGAWAPSAVRAEDGAPITGDEATPAADAPGTDLPAMQMMQAGSALVSVGVPLANGWFFPAGDDASVGVAILDEPGGPPFWTSYQRLGGVAVLGAPLSRPFLLPDGRFYLATAYALLVWQPGAALAEYADALDMMAAAGVDDWLLTQGVPRAERSADVLDRLGWLSEPAIRDAYFGGGEAGATPLLVSEAVGRFGLPASRPQAFDGQVTQRFQRGALRVSTAGDGAPLQASPLAVGELLRDSGLLAGALVPDHLVGGSLVARAPRPQLAWRSDTGWGMSGATGGASGPGGAAEPPVTATAGASVQATATTVPTVVPSASSTPVAAVPPAAGIGPTATPASGSAAGGNSARPAALPQPGAAIVIREIVNQGRAEHVVVANDGTAAQELTGWTLRSPAGGQTYVFPPGFVLGPGGTVNVHSGAGDPVTLNRPPTDLYATKSNVWNNGGDVGQILDPTGRVVSEKRYGTT
jgi:hypothetical protein